MIRIDMTLVPASGGDEQHLGTATITNTGQTTLGGSSYIFRLLKGARYSRRAGEVWKQAVVDDAPAPAGRPPRTRVSFVAGFPRASRGVGPWELLGGCLQALVGARWQPQPEAQARVPLDWDGVADICLDLRTALTSPDVIAREMAVVALARLVCAVSDRLRLSPQVTLVRVRALLEVI